MSIEIINSFYKKAASLKNISTLELQILNEIKKELRNLSSNGLINFLLWKLKYYEIVKMWSHLLVHKLPIYLVGVHISYQYKLVNWLVK